MHNAQAERVVVLATNDWEYARPTYPWAQDHAGKWETSLMMALRPRLVEMKELPPADEAVTAMGPIDPRGEADRSLGEVCVELIVAQLAVRVRRIVQGWSDEGRNTGP